MFTIKESIVVTCFLCLCKEKPERTFHAHSTLCPGSINPLKEVLEDLGQSAQLRVKLTEQTLLCFKCCKMVASFIQKKSVLLERIRKAMPHVNVALDEVPIIKEEILCPVEPAQDPISDNGNEIDQQASTSTFQLNLNNYKNTNEEHSLVTTQIKDVEHNTSADSSFSDDEMETQEVEEKKFHCNLCSYAHYSESHVILHKNIHKGLEEFQCPCCLKVLPKKRICLWHMEIHTNYGKYPTLNNESSCDEETSEEEDEEMPIDEENKKYKCDVCSFAHWKENYLMLHKNKHNGLRETQCPICHKLYFKKSHCIRHFTTVHASPEKNDMIVIRKRLKKKVKAKKKNVAKRICLSNVQKIVQLIVNDEKEKKFRCDVCSFTHYSECHVVLHKNIHKGLKESQCPFCLRILIKKSHTMRHMHTHTNFGKYPTDESCSDDKMSESEKITFMPDEKLIARKNNLKKFKCDLCDFSHEKEEHLILHKGSHKGLKETQCPLCLRTFSVKSSTIKHIIAVHIYNNNQCETCGSCFNNFHAFINHKLKHEAEENPIFCKICGKRFVTMKTFRKHQVTHRDDRPRYTCEQCKRIFVDRRAYRIHSQTKHKEDEESEDTQNSKNRNKFICLICNQSFQSKEHLDKHMKRKHDVIIQPVASLPKS